MKKLEQVNTYLNKFDETILKLLKESNVNSRTIPKTQIKTETTKDLISDCTPVSILGNSQLKKSNLSEHSNSYRIHRARQDIKTQTFEKFQFIPQETQIHSPIGQNLQIQNNSTSTGNILDRLKAIEGHYANKVRILEDDNNTLRKQSQNDKLQLEMLQSKIQQLNNELIKQQEVFQEIISKQMQDQKQQFQFELQEQESRLKRQFERQLSKKESRIQDLEQLQQTKRTQNLDNNTYHLLTFKPTDQ